MFDYHKKNLSHYLLVLRYLILYPFVLLLIFFRKVTPDFTYRGKILPYFVHFWNFTYINERCVELSIARDFLSNSQNKKVLELGNVCKRYFNYPRMVIDKYELSSDVINIDILDYNDQSKFDRILSISTVEHIGLDEIENDGAKAIIAVEKLISLLKDDGKILITFAIGYNKCLDFFFLENNEYLKYSRFYMRKGLFCSWSEVGVEEAKKSKCNDPYPFANGLLVFEMTKSFDIRVSK